MAAVHEVQWSSPSWHMQAESRLKAHEQQIGIMQRQMDALQVCMLNPCSGHAVAPSLSCSPRSPVQWVPIWMCRP